MGDELDLALEKAGESDENNLPEEGDIDAQAAAFSLPVDTELGPRRLGDETEVLEVNAATEDVV